MSPVDFQKRQCRISLLLHYSHVLCRISEMFMSHVTMIFEPLSHVEFKKHLCRPVFMSHVEFLKKNGFVDFRDLGPYQVSGNTSKK